jgi:hypothetical protein
MSTSADASKHDAGPAGDAPTGVPHPAVEFVEVDGFILRQGYSPEALRRFRQREGADRAGVESVMNHWHLDGIQYIGCPDASPDKLLHLGRTLEQIYTAKLQWQFPERPCRVSLYVPDDPLLLNQYEITFWQVANEHVPA